MLIRSNEKVSAELMQRTKRKWPQESDRDRHESSNDTGQIKWPTDKNAGDTQKKKKRIVSERKQRLLVIRRNEKQAHNDGTNSIRIKREVKTDSAKIESSVIIKLIMQKSNATTTTRSKTALDQVN